MTTATLLKSAKIQNVYFAGVRSTKQLGLWRAIALLFLCFGLISCNDKQEFSWNQKLTIVVDTPNGEVSGSAVNNVSWQALNAVSNYPASYRGEATVVDLGDGKYLFALIGDETKFLAFRTFKAKERNLGVNLFAEMQGLRAVGPVPRKYFPRLVAFMDIENPKSVVKIDPGNLSVAFGAGYDLKSITLETTDEPVTKGLVERVLSWVTQLKNKQLDGRRLRGNPDKTPFANQLNSVDFLGVS